MNSAADGSARRRFEDAWIWILPFALWALGHGFTFRFASNVPYWDAWEYVESVTGQRPITPIVFWEQHNEHRIVWQTIFELAWARLTHWNLYVAAFFPLLFIGASNCGLIAATVRGREGLGRVERVLLVAVLSFLLFTPRIWEHLLWDMMICWGALALAMTVFARRFTAYLASGRGAPALAALLVAAAFSTGQGLAPAVFVLGAGAIGWLARRQVEPRLPRSHAALALLSAALLVVYFAGYEKPPYHPPTGTFLTRPWDALGYLAVLVGGPLSYDPARAMPIGIVVAMLLAAGLVALLRRRGWRGAWHVVAHYPLLPLSAAVLVAQMVGRVGFGPAQAILSRYSLYSVLFLVSALLLCFDQLTSLGARRGALAVALVVTLPAWALCARQALAEGDGMRANLEAYRDCVLANPIDASGCDGWGVYPTQELLVRRTAALRAQRLCFFADPP